MKLLILSPDIYTRGGIARYSATLASALGDILGPDNVYVQPLLGTTGTPETSSKYRVLNPVSCQLTTSSKLRFFGRALGLGSRKYDLIICTHIGLAPIAAMMRMFWGTPFWVTCHGIEVWRPLPFAERTALRCSHTVIPISRFTAEKIAEVNGVPRKKMSILYNAVPDEFVDLLSSTDEMPLPHPPKEEIKILLSVGMLSKDLAYKGFDTVIQALPKVMEAFPNLRYVVVGEGDNKENLRKLAVQIGVEKHVEFTGSISDAELAAWYRSCDVFVLPSRVRQSSGHWEGEGFGRVYVEAALAGKPVVGSRDGGAAEAVLNGKTGLLVDPASLPEITGALVKLLDDPASATQMGKRGRQWAMENFTTRALRGRLKEVLRGVGAPLTEENNAVSQEAVI